jgi:Domain of unknown function (DUF6438)
MRLVIASLAVVLMSFPKTYGQSISGVRHDEKQECISRLSGFSNEPTATASAPYPSNLDGVTIEYFASGCYGSCPAFTLRIGKAYADWDGHNYVRAKGKRRAKVTQQQFDAFLRGWFDGRFYAMREDYCTTRCPNGMVITVTDIPESSIILKTSEFTKRVYECFATINAEPITPKPPEEYFKLAKQLREFAKSKKWLR